MFVITHRVIATTFALTSFAAAILVGVWAENVLVTILSRAILTMLVCYMVGLLIGGVAQRVIHQHVEDYKLRNPLPGDPQVEAKEVSSAVPSNNKRPRTT